MRSATPYLRGFVKQTAQVNRITFTRLYAPETYSRSSKLGP